MMENPFQIIRSTDQPPEHLRKEVMTSVKLVMLVMRFLQLFVADFSMSAFDKVRRVDPTTPAKGKGPTTETTP
ncbi:MAG: hypothetical protein IPH05_09790 [Flavobacteriales bacterium]|jgi:hypothetical protein|nr:hypothetical protein [Flavobacteriales bacterium]MBK6552179.1 hypothetical protein [Flavobacteriales bacterium]MBK6883216.1 hypothetical protein [Flavobacteriales bacterium]MBK7103255.1 hypothetical protein [Flavobacteriales bacterium]MBK7112773.1 hypothetical protein [Flavobacteriales bacterium]